MDKLAFPVLHILTTTCYLCVCVCLIVVILVSVQWYLTVVLFAFFCWSVMLSIFSNVFWPFVYLLWKNFYSSLLTIFKIRLFDFVCFWIVGILYIFWLLTSCRRYDLQITPSTLELYTVLLPQQLHKQAVTLSPGDRCISEIRLVSPLRAFLALTVTSDLHMHQSLSLVYSIVTPSSVCLLVLVQHKYFSHSTGSLSLCLVSFHAQNFLSLMWSHLSICPNTHFFCAISKKSLANPMLLRCPLCFLPEVL